MEIKAYQDAEGRFPPAKSLNYLEMLLTGEASDWSESNLNAIRLLTEVEVAPSQQTIQQFRAVFCKRFPSKVVEATPIPFDVELTDLRQRPDKPLSAYYT